jgi:hypothetical protein
MNKNTQLLKNDIKNFILSDNITNAYREHLLDEILEDYFETLDDDMIEEYEDYMFPIMEAIGNPNDNLFDADDVEKCIADGNDYSDCVDRLVESMETN